jgi:hypothetical protein
MEIISFVSVFPLAARNFHGLMLSFVKVPALFLKMSETSIADIVVIGSSGGGLSCAALLA